MSFNGHFWNHTINDFFALLKDPKNNKQMKSRLILALAVSVLIFSCSTDGDDDDANTELGANALVGTWNMTDIRFEEDPEDTSLNLADEIFDRLSQEDCVLVSFTFNADGTMSGSSKLDFIEINASPAGLDVSCPEQSETETGTWVLEGNQLTVDNGSGDMETTTIELEGNTMIIAGDEIDENNYAGAEAVFTRQ